MALLLTGRLPSDLLGVVADLGDFLLIFRAPRCLARVAAGNVK
jgi:hypothetical protein